MRQSRSEGAPASEKASLSMQSPTFSLRASSARIRDVPTAQPRLVAYFGTREKSFESKLWTSALFA
jgi:hypothetical protein